MQIVELKVNVEKSQLEALAAEVNKLNGKVINFKTSTTGAGAATAGMQKGFNQTAAAADKAGQSILGVVGKVAKWTAVTTAVYAPIKAFKEAVTTIKALDTEMVNVQKVTGASARQMQQFQDRAYQLSTQYGRSVTDVAAAMTSFARAGYGDKLDEMAELSTLVQNVGYVSEDTADRMLLAVDAAWKLGGSQTELMKVIDGVDKVTNQNATDFQKMAEGMTVAASVFAESGESIQTFAAMVGTGTAATQRGGSEIARGLRTIMMNIRQIKGETEDGELIDGESIAKASAALKEFAGISTMENGELRKASDVLADLAHKWDELDTVQQSAISEALAGKRQANILTALMGNWDMVEKQMKEYADAAGTAFKENDIYMDSWAAKTEQLKAKWTDFVSNFVTSDLATGFLGGLIKAVEVLDSGFGQAAISALALKLAISGIVKAVGAIAGAGIVKDLVAFISLLSTEGVAAFSLLAGVIGPIGIAVAAIAGIIAGVKLYDFFHVDYDEQIEKVKELKGEYEELYGVQGEYEALRAKESDGSLSAYEQSRLDYLEQYKKSLEETMELEKKAALEKYKQEYGSESKHDDKTKLGSLHDRMETAEPEDVVTLREAQKAFDELTASVKDGSKSRTQAKDEMQGLLDTYKDFYEEIQTGIDLGAFELEDLDPATQDMMRLYDTMKALVDLPVEEWGIGSAIMQFDQLAEVGDKSVYNLQAFKQALADAGASAEDIEGTIAQLQSDDNAILIDVEAENIDSTIDSLKELGIATEEAGQTKVNVDEFASLAKQLGLSKDQAIDLAQRMKDAGASIVDAKGNAADVGTAFDNAYNPIEKLTQNVENLVNTIREINGLPPLELKADASQAEGAIDSVEGKKDTFEQPANSELSVTDNASQPIMTAEAEATRFGNMRPRPTISVNDQASGVLGRIIGLIGAIKNKAVTITTTHIDNRISYTGTSTMDVHGHATGTLNFRGGPTLLGDELSPDGSPRPELVITKNGAFIAGMAGPVATSLPAGSRIYKYSDTMEILSGGDLTQLQAFGPGNIKLLDAWKNRGNQPASKPTPTPTPKPTPKPDPSPKPAPSGGSGGSGGRGGRGSGSSGGGSGSSGSGKSSVDTLKEELELLESQYSFLEASNASTEELWAKSDEIKSKLHQINDTLRSTGGKEKDIVDYSTKWWQEQEKIRETTQKFYEDQRKLLDTELEIMEASEKTLSNKAAEREEIEKTLQAYQQGGNVNLLKRPVIDASILRDVGWDDAGDGKATVFSSTFSNEDGSLAINFTPIIADKDGNFVDALEPDSLWEYAEEVIEGVHDDYLGLQIGAKFTGEDAIEQAEKAAEEIHNLHEKYFLEDIWKEETIYEAQIERIKAIQDSLHQEAEYLRSIGADQADINELSAQWWQELKKIHEVQRKVYQDERDLLQSQADLMGHQNKSAGERIAKLREIQDNLHKEAEYMRSIKADQAEINQLSIQWWEVQEQILQIQKDLAESLDATVRARLRQIGDEKDDAIETIRDQIKDIEKERDDKLKELIEVKYRDLELNRDDLDLEKAKLEAQEKRNKLLEAEQNLRNAMNERNVRSYNASTGQWEMIADARSVKRAQEELERARKDIESADKDIRQQEYELERKRLEDDYGKKIQAKEDQIDKLTDEFDDLEKEWERMYDRMFGEALGNIENILQQMLDTGVITEDQANEIRAFWGKINGFAESIDLTTSEILRTLKSWKEFQEEVPEATPSGYVDYLTDFLNENGWTDENYNAAVAMAKAMARETGASSQLAVLAARKIKADAGLDPYDQGYDKPSQGGAAAAAAKAVSDAINNSGGTSSKSIDDKVNDRLKERGINPDSPVAKAMRENPSHFGIYDSGGILSGFGGIKASARDEIVIPPDLADYMLRPSANNTFKSRVSELAYLYGAKPISSTLSNNRSSNDHYGDTYTFGNVTLTEDKARTTTVYELAQMSRSLGIYRNG